MENQPIQEEPKFPPVVEKAIKKFTDAEKAYREAKGGVTEIILDEVKETAVDALIQSGADKAIMRALLLNFINPILKDAINEGDAMTQMTFRVLLADIATEVTHKILRRIVETSKELK